MLNKIVFISALLMSASTYSIESNEKAKHKLWSSNRDKVRSAIDKELKKPVTMGPANYKNNIRIELAYEEIQHNLIKKLENHLRNNDIKSLKSMTLPEFKISSLGELSKDSESYSNLKITDWKKSSKQKGINELGSYLSSFNKIDHAEISVLNYLLPKKGVFPKNIDKLTLKANFDLRGISKNKNLRRNDKGSLSILVKKVKNTWAISNIKLEKAQTLTSTKPTFTKVSDSSLKGLKSHTRKEAIRRGGYAISTTDIDKDGKVDLYMGAYGKSQMLKGNGDGSFTVKNYKGLRGETLVKSAAFVDLDNDSDQDLILVRFNPNDADGSTNIVIYNNEKGKFVERHNFPSEYRSFYAMPSTVADFNNDSLLDLYVGFPGAKDFTVLKDPKHIEGMKIQGLFENKGNLSFLDKSENLPLRNAKENQILFPHGSLSVDMDLDGDMDILVVDDRGNVSPIYKNNGKGKFSMVNDQINVELENYGMTVIVGDVNNDGLQDIAFSQVNFNSFKRIKNSLQSNFGSDFRDFEGAQGVSLYINNGKTFTEESKKWGLSNTGEGVAGIEFIDYNNDGLQDIYLANGLWSGSKGGHDLSSLFVSAAWLELVHLEHDLIQRGESRMEIAHSVFMNILTHVQGGINNKFEKGIRPSLAGDQRNRLFRNTGKGSFIEVGYLEGVDSIADGYVLSKADINNDGYVDLALRNGDPGTESIKYAPVEIYLNNNRENKTVFLTLEGTKSNKDAIGTIAKAKIGNKWYVQHLMGNNGTAQSQKMLSFGLAGQDSIEELLISWPSGLKTQHKNIEAGRHHIVESDRKLVSSVAK